MRASRAMVIADASSDIELLIEYRDEKLFFTFLCFERDEAPEVLEVPLATLTDGLGITLPARITP